MINKSACNLRLFLFPLLICTAGQVFAQNKSSIKGQVKDEKENKLELVGVSLLNAADSTLIKSAATNSDGYFEFDGQHAGRYLFRISNIGYKPLYTEAFDLKEGQLFEMAPVHLLLETKDLQGVVISSRKPLVQVKTDRVVFNVQNSINATGSNVLEILQKSPGIQVDNNDKITYKGKVGVKIYVDGKMTQLGTDDLAAYLKSINSNDVDAIEIIDNPGAQFDSSGNAGVINIKLKKNKNLGTNGNITMGLIQGKTPKENGAASLNYRSRRINIFSNLSVNNGKNETDIYAPRTQKDTTYNQRLVNTSKVKDYNIKAGADYFMDNKQTIGVMITSNINNENWKSIGKTDIYYQPTDSYVKLLTSTNSIPRNRTNTDYNLNYRYLDSIGREIDFDADYGQFRGRANSYQTNNYQDQYNNFLSDVITRNNTPTDIDIYTAKLDGGIPVRHGKLSMGAKFSYVKSANTFDFFNISNQAEVKSLSSSYYFTYKENVNAAYVNYQMQLSKQLTIQTGLRMEQTNSDGELVREDGVTQADGRVKRNYLDLFPNVTFTWITNPNNTFNLFYNRRIDRPSYQDLNPFEIKLDELSYVKGNSFLRPQYTDNIELSQNWMNKIITSIGFSHVKDFVAQTTDTLKNYTYLQMKNIASQDIANITIGAPLEIRKWWQAYLNIWFNYQFIKGTINENPLDVKIPAYGAFTQQTFILGNDYTAELSGFFNGPALLGSTFRARSFGGLDAGLQKTFWGKRATIKITATDILHTASPFRAKSDFCGLLINIAVARESQTGRISFIYRFGSSKIAASRQRQTGLETESKRVKSN